MQQSVHRGKSFYYMFMFQAYWEKITWFSKLVQLSISKEFPPLFLRNWICYALYKKQGLSLNSVSNPFHNNTKSVSYHVLITINACLTHSSLPYRCLFLQTCVVVDGGGVDRTSYRNLGSSFSMFLFDFSKAQFLKCHQKFSKFQNWFNAKGAFCVKKADAALRSLSLL